MVHKDLILVVDDNYSLLFGTCKILEDAGYQTIKASSGAEGLLFATEHKPDLVLLDVGLPDIDGYEVCRQFRSDIHLVDCGIIMISSIDTKSDHKSHGLEIGADDFIPRPVPKRELLARINSLLRLKRSEKALRESEKKFRTIADFTYDWEYWLAPDASLVYVSPSCERITGYKNEDFMNNPKLLRQIVHPGDRAEMGDILETVNMGGRHAVEFRIITRSGEERWIGHECQAVFDDEGNFLGRRGSNRDITSQKYTEQTLSAYQTNLEKLVEERTEELAQSELKFRSIFENSLDGIILMSPDGNVRMVNSSACNILGRTESEICRMGQTGIVDPTDSQLKSLLDKGKRSGEHSGEINILRGDGTIVPVDMTSRFFKLPDGQEMVVVGLRDLTAKKESEKALIESESRYRQLSDNSLTGIFIHQDGLSVYTNQELADMLGFTLEEMAGRRFVEAVCPDDLEQVMEYVQARFRGEVPLRPTQFRLLKKTGETIWCDCLTSLINYKGRPAIMGNLLDITERKNIEEEAQRFSNELADRVKQLDCLYGISRLVERPGTSWDEIVQGIVDLIPPAWQYPEITCARIILEDREFTTERYADTPWKQSADIVIQGDHIGRIDVVYEELRPINDDGPFRIQERALLNAIAERLGNIIDKIRSEEALRASEERFRLIAETISDSIWLLDKDYHVKYVSPSDEKMRGFKPEETLGRPVFETLNPDYAQSLKGAAFQRQADEEGRQKTGVRTYEAEVVCKNGRSMLAEGKFTPVRDNEGVISGFVGVMRDISERKRTEELAIQTARLKSVAALSEGVAHHFNNLLQIMIGGITLALDGLECGDHPGVRNWLEKMMAAASRGATMVKHLQTFTHNRTSDAEREGAIFDVAATVRSAAEVSNPLRNADYERKGIKIELQMLLEDDCMIRGQEDEIFEVIVNLLKNSAEALPKGGLIEAKTFRQADEVVITVRDTGTGISDAELPYVFQPFWTTKGFDIGKGMGLAVAHGLVNRHSGNISVQSREGEGTTLTIRFPLVHGPVKKTEQPASSANERHLTILVIDDEEDVAELVETMFSRAGHRIFKALSGEDGLKIFNNQKIDLVVCDLGMPGMNGWLVGKAIREICTERRTTKPPFVLLTGWGGQELEKEKMFESGVDQVITKPIRKSLLLSAIDEIAGQFNIGTRHLKGHI